MQRCNWVSQDQIYIDYHDKEWGIPETNGKNLFKMICLEGQQAGLSWITVLKKRENYVKAFLQFDPLSIARMTNKDVEKLMQDTGIIRHESKIKSIINNARAWITMEQNGEPFSDFIWRFVNYTPQINQTKVSAKIPTSTSTSDALSRALKKRNFTFVGSIICYSFMQACGMVNDHIIDCFCHSILNK